MKKYSILFILIFFVSCATTGPVYIATGETETIKRFYDEPRLQQLALKYENSLRQIYSRFISSGIPFYREGLGFTTIRDELKETYYYLMIHIRPQDIVFNENATKPEQRFSEVLTTYFQKYMNYIEKEDFDKDDIDGLALGIYWPVRDFSQCKQSGGFVEYTIIYFTKNDMKDYKAGLKSFVEVVDNSEVITSLNRQTAQSVRPLF